MAIKKNDVKFVVAMLSALWFTASAYIWVYFFAIIFSYPFGLISLLLWYNLRKEQDSRAKYILLLLIIGFVISMSAILFLMYRNNT